MKINNLSAIGLVVVFAGIGFFAGFKYQQGKQPSFSGVRSGIQRGQQVPDMTHQRVEDDSEVIRGKVIDRGQDSVTVELTDGGSRLILISDNTQINKTVEMEIDDLKIDDQVMVFGKANPDQSVSANQIQINFGVGR